MPIIVDTPTTVEEVTQAMFAGLRQLLGTQKVYVLGLQDVHNGKTPTENDYAGWQYLTPLAPHIGLSNRVSQKLGAAPVFAGISYGRQAALAIQTFPQLDALPGIPEGSYQATMLSIPALLTESFWLRTQPAGTDWVVVYDSNAPGLQLMHAYTMAEFLQILQPLALSRLRFAEAYPGPPESNVPPANPLR
jgi:hypothetical protein